MASKSPRSGERSYDLTAFFGEEVSTALPDS
jgi:hypothetical protein